MKNEPWARLTTCSMPKISVRPAANRKIRSPYATPFSPWTMMKSGLTTPDSRPIMIDVRSMLSTYFGRHRQVHDLTSDFLFRHRRLESPSYRGVAAAQDGYV